MRIANFDAAFLPRFPKLLQEPLPTSTAAICLGIHLASGEVDLYLWIAELAQGH
jgi:hypothetical protein